MRSLHCYSRWPDAAVDSRGGLPHPSGVADDGTSSVVLATKHPKVEFQADSGEAEVIEEEEEDKMKDKEEKQNDGQLSAHSQQSPCSQREELIARRQLYISEAELALGAILYTPASAPYSPRSLRELSHNSGARSSTHSTKSV